MPPALQRMQTKNEDADFMKVLLQRQQSEFSPYPIDDLEESFKSMNSLQETRQRGNSFDQGQHLRTTMKKLDKAADNLIDDDENVKLGIEKDKKIARDQ